LFTAVSLFRVRLAVRPLVSPNINEIAPAWYFYVSVSLSSQGVVLRCPATDKDLIGASRWKEHGSYWETTAMCITAFRRTFSITLLAVSAVILGLSSSAALAADPNIVVTLKGTGLPVATPPGVAGDCFETTLFNTHTGSAIGTGLDCLEIIEASEVGLSLNRTTIFKFPQGDLYANGLTPVLPVFGDSSPGSTHIVGDVDDSSQNIVCGTRAFRMRTGSVRLSGAVNLADFPNTLGFNCIFVINLD